MQLLVYLNTFHPDFKLELASVGGGPSEDTLSTVRVSVAGRQTWNSAGGRDKGDFVLLASNLQPGLGHFLVTANFVRLSQLPI